MRFRYAAEAATQQAYEDGQAALRAGDFTAYGEAQDRLNAALQRADAAAQALGVVPKPTGTPSPTSSAVPSASPASNVS